MVKKVEIEKADTHIYSEYVSATSINTGEATSIAAVPIVLFDKSLVLTSDLKRLPYIVGGKCAVYFDPTIHTDLVTSVLAGLHVTVALFNGDMVSELDGANNLTWIQAIMDVLSRKKELLMVAHGLIWRDVQNLELEFDHGQFLYSGEKILYDTLTLAIFANSDANPTQALASFAWGEVVIEVDWKEFSEADLKEFLLEHVYARGGD